MPGPGGDAPAEQQIKYWQEQANRPCQRCQARAEEERARERVAEIREIIREELARRFPEARWDVK